MTGILEWSSELLWYAHMLNLVLLSLDQAISKLLCGQEQLSSVSLCSPEPMYHASLISKMDNPFFLTSFATWPNFPAAYMVITFHVPTLLLWKGWLSAGSLPDFSGFHCSASQDLDFSWLVLFQGPSSARAEIFWFSLADVSIAIMFLGRGC